MGYLSINTDVDIDFDDIDDDDLMDIIEYKLSQYKRSKTEKYYKGFRKSILDCLDYNTAGDDGEEEGTVEEWLKDKTIETLKTMYTLEELEAFTNKA